MPTFNELRQDHQALRRTLSALQKVLACSDAPIKAKPAYESLMEMFEAHIQREEQAMSAYCNRVKSVQKSWALYDRPDPRTVLKDIDVIFSSRKIISTATLVNNLCQLIDELRECLDAEEKDLFPVIEHAQEETRVVCYDLY